MTDQGAYRSAQSGRGAFQPIEQVAEPPSSPVMVEPAPQPVEAEPYTPVVDPALVVTFAARFSSAASALVFAGQLLSIGSADDLTFHTGPEQSWWVLAPLELDIAREFAAATRGEAYVEVTPGRLVPDLGWGGPPAFTEDSATVSTDDLTEVGIREMIRVSGLHSSPVRPLAEVSVFLPGSLTADVVRRALDLRLDVAHRAVRLRPLFNGHSPETVDAPAVVELLMSAPEGQLPGGLLLALARDSRMTLCRRTGQNGNLLIQHGMATPLPDHLLAGLAHAESWLLSRGPLGCRSVETVDGFTDSMTLLRLTDSYPLDSQEPVAHDPAPQLPELRVVPARTTGCSIDALLLNTADLNAVRMLLEGHPLAESAHVVRGRDRHLLLAPGGLLEPLPVGEALYCWGPGPLYLPIGFALRPQLPSVARRAIFNASEQTAVVLLPNVRIHFALPAREPVWALWAGPPPAVEEALPPEAVSTLTGVLDPVPAGKPTVRDKLQGKGRHRAKRRAQQATGTWLDDALDAELSGRLVQAAELHERHGDPVRAAHLFERAAREGRGVSSP